jgi:hypothetical protein
MRIRCSLEFERVDDYDLAAIIVKEENKIILKFGFKEAEFFLKGDRLEYLNTLMNF